MSKHMLKGGYELILDDEDDWIAEAGSMHLGIRGGKPFTVTCRININRFALKETGRLEVDHINRDPLDNRKSNLRVVSSTQNKWNRISRGYSWHNGRKKWVAYLRHHGSYRYLGLFQTEIEAAFAVWEARKKLRGEFATMPPILETMRDKDGLIV